MNESIFLTKTDTPKSPQQRTNSHGIASSSLGEPHEKTCDLKVI